MNIEYGSCKTLFHKDCDAYVVLEREFCKKDTYCFPIEDFSIEPFGNFVAAVAIALDLVSEGEKVCVCDKGGCGRSGTVAGAVLAYLYKDVSFPRFKKFVRVEYRLFKECPEKPEQEQAIRLSWGAFHHFSEEAFRLLTRTTFTKGAFVTAVNEGRKGKFIPILLVTRKPPHGSEANIRMNVDELKKVSGRFSYRVLQEFMKVPKEGRIVKLEEVKPEEVCPYALSFAAFEGSVFKVQDPREALRLLSQALLLREL